MTEHRDGDTGADRILIVEDSRTQAAYLRFLLEENGYEVDAAINGIEALQQARAALPSLVISDIVMPGMDGYDLCKTFKADPDLGHVPVILVTSLTGPQDILRGVEAQADNILSKPFNEEQLLERISSTLRRARREHRPRTPIRFDIQIDGREESISADGGQVLEILVSVYEQAIHLNRQMLLRQEDLERGQTALQWTNELGRLLAQYGHRREIAEVVATHALAFASVRAAWLVTVDDDGVAEVTARAGLPLAEACVGPDGTGCACLAGAGTVSVGEIAQVADCRMVPSGKDGTSVRHVAVTIRAADRLLGVLCLLAEAGSEWSAEQNAILAAAGERVGAGFERAELLESLERRVEERTAQLTAEIAERRRAEGETLERAQRLRVLMDNIPDCIVTIDERGIIESVNHAVGIVFGYTEAEVVGHNVKMLMNAEDADRHDGYLQRYRETGVARILGMPHRELTGRRKDGTELPVNLIVRDMLLNGRRLFIGVLRDITVHREAERELRESRERFDRAVNGAGAGIWDWNLETDAYYASHKLMEMLGRADDDLSIADYHGLIHGDDRDRVLAAVRAHTRDGRPYSMEYRIRREDGEYLWVLDSGRAIRDQEGRAVSFAGSIIDISDRKAAEAHLLRNQKMEAIGQLTGGIAHDFNNLLMVIMGNLELLEAQMGADAPDRELVETALHASKRGSDLTRQLLAFARKQTLAPRSVEISDLVTGVGRLLIRILGQDIRLQLHVADDLWPVQVDPSQLESALANLAVNARDAMPAGGSLAIGVCNKSLDDSYAASHDEVTPGDYVCIEVSDTGIGMSPEVLKRVFEPFFTTKQEGKGTGLGLAMIFGFVKQSRGHISVYSELGEGTTFRIYLPRRDRDGASAGNGVARPAPVIAGRKPVVLVVDDNAEVKTLVMRHLVDAGYEVLGADDPFEALAYLESGVTIDMVFSDVVMPGGMNGVELAHEVVARWPERRVLLTSGFPDTALRADGRVDDGFQILSKPYQRIDLLEAIARALEGDGS